MNCPYCNSVVEENWSYCRHCNHPLLTNIEQRFISPSHQAFSDQEIYMNSELEKSIEFDPNIIVDESIESKLQEINFAIQQKENYGEFIPGNLLLRKAGLLYNKRDLSGAFKVLELALNSYNEEEDTLKTAIVNSEMALIQEELGFFDSAIYHNERAIEILRKLNDPAKLIQVYNNIANVYYILKDLEHSYEFYKKAINLSEVHHLILEEIKTSSNMVDILFLLRDYERIEKILKRNLSYFEQVGDAYGYLITISKLGKLYYLGEKNYTLALEHFNKTQEIISSYYNRGDLTPMVKSQLEWEVLYYLGKIELLYNNDKKAEDLLLKSLEAVRTFEVGESIKEGTVLESIAELYEVKGNLSKAIEYYDLSNEIYYKFGDDAKTAEIKFKIGNTYFNLFEDKSEAIKYYEEALDLYEELEYTKESAEILNKLGDIFIQKGMVDAAISNFKRAKEYYKEIKDEYNLNLINEKINSLTNSETEYY